MILLVTAALSLAVLLTGCSLFQSTEPTPTGTPTPAPTATHTPEPTVATAPAPTSPIEIDLDSDSLWQEAFESFSDAEQTCIRNKLGDELPASVLGLRVVDELNTVEPWQVSIFECLDPETADILFLSLLSVDVYPFSTPSSPTAAPVPTSASAGTIITDGPTIVSSPTADSDGDGIDDTYTPGDVITIRIWVSEQSCGYGTAVLIFQTGDGSPASREADYGGCGPDFVDFEYTVAPDDLDSDGLSIQANSITLTTYEGIVRHTAHPEVPSNPYQKINAHIAVTTPPRIIGSPRIVNIPLDENALREGDQIVIGVSFGEQVLVNTGGGLPTVAMDLGSEARNAQYVGQVEDPSLLLFGYTVQGRDRGYIGELCVPAPITGDGEGITVHPGSSITDNAGNHADLSWEETFCHFGLYLDEGPASPTPTLAEDTFISISAGALHTCGVMRNGSIKCWGSNEDEFGNVFGQATPPGGEFNSVSAGLLHTCGMKTDGSVACWGWNEDGQATPPNGEFASVSAGLLHTCGVKTDGSLTCWGWNENGQATPPNGEFASISAGAQHTCGVRTEGSLVCWGSNDSGQVTPPSGEFASVSAGFLHTCGLKGDGSVACWGSNEDLEDNVVGQATPPGGEFVSVNAGVLHTCGVKGDGLVACWGSNEDFEGNVVGQSMPPGGEFVSVSAGALHTCGVRIDGYVACWGLNEDGQSTPPD